MICEEELELVWKAIWQGSQAPSLEADVSGLSAGERQRICLARALLHRPLALILDEATNALDLVSEQNAWRFVREWLPQSLILVAAHRIDSFSNAEYRLSIDKGQITSVKTGPGRVTA